MALRRHRPAVRKGDARRAALLSTLEELLSDRALADISIADITSAAGVTRQAFYFYFPGKAAAVAALLEDLSEEILSATAGWYDDDQRPSPERLRAAFKATIRAWRSHATLMVAMLDATGTDPEVRRVWDGWLDAFIERVAARIREERASGVATGTTDASALATALVGAVAFAMERDVRSIQAGHRPGRHTADALITLWERAIYDA